MNKLGYHVSVAGGIQNAPINAFNGNCETFQMFLSSPRVWKYPKLEEKNIIEFKDNVKKFQFDNITVHFTYLANLASSDKELRKKAFNALKEEIKRCDLLGVNNLVMHTGSHKGTNLEGGIENIVSMLKKAIDLNPKVKLVLETSAGGKNSLGSKFNELKTIINAFSDDKKDSLGICIDTCHIFASGYDISEREGVDKTLEEFDEQIGIEYLKVIHANDSKGNLGEHKDRHEHIGLGGIGEVGFRALLNHPLIDGIPFILETPNDTNRKFKDNLNILFKLRA